MTQWIRLYLVILESTTGDLFGVLAVSFLSRLMIMYLAKQWVMAQILQSLHPHMGDPGVNQQIK